MPVTGSNQIQYNLSIRISADGFSFFVTEASSGDLLHREDYQAQGTESVGQAFRQAIARPTITHQDFSEVRVVVDSDATSVPLAVFRDDTVDSAYQQVFSRADLLHNSVETTEITPLEVVELYTIPAEVCRLTLEFFPQATFCNVYAAVMQYVANFSQQRMLTEQPLFAYVYEDQLFVYSIHAGKLMFANKFPLENGQNALFFLLSVWKELGLDVHESFCFVGGGDETTVSRLAGEVRKYILHVELMDKVAHVHF